MAILNSTRFFNFCKSSAYITQGYLYNAGSFFCLGPIGKLNKLTKFLKPPEFPNSCNQFSPCLNPVLPTKTPTT